MGGCEHACAFDLCLCETGRINLNFCSAKPLLGHRALVWLVGFRMADFMLPGIWIKHKAAWEFGIKEEYMDEKMSRSVLGGGWPRW